MLAEIWSKKNHQPVFSVFSQTKRPIHFQTAKRSACIFTGWFYCVHSLYIMAVKVHSEFVSWHKIEISFGLWQVALHEKNNNNEWTFLLWICFLLLYACKENLKWVSTLCLHSVRTKLGNDIEVGMRSSYRFGTLIEGQLKECLFSMNVDLFWSNLVKNVEVFHYSVEQAPVTSVWGYWNPCTTCENTKLLIWMLFLNFFGARFTLDQQKATELQYVNLWNSGSIIVQSFKSYNAK